MTEPMPRSTARVGAEADRLGLERLPNEVLLGDVYEKIGAPIGEGTYGTVWRARCRKTDRTVAIKRVVLRNDREGFPVTAIREIRALRRLQHPNIVSLLDVCTCSESGTAGDAYLIFEYAPSDLTGLLEYRKRKLKPPEIKCIIRQLVNALDFCHMKHFMHRDLKPSNILVTARGELKLCDFGLSREFKGFGSYSTRVITLWYRPPELLLSTKQYDQSVDVWSAGCIFGELLIAYPLFPENSEVRVFQKICERCGALSASDWPSILRSLPNWDKIFVAKRCEAATGDVFRDVHSKNGPHAADLLRKMLRLDPSERIGTDAVVEHPFFSQEPFPCQPSEIKMPHPGQSVHELDVKRHREKLREDKEARVQCAAVAARRQAPTRRSRSPRKDRAL